MREALRTALYARVSSEQQAGDSAIASQLAALEARVAEDGLTVLPEYRFADDGYSGATLIRPALERLRDLAASGALDRVYVHSPDRLTRRYAYQGLLVDELRRAGVEIVFLNRQIGVSPDDLLLQVQGMVAEYAASCSSCRRRDRACTRRLILPWRVPVSPSRDWSSWRSRSCWRTSCARRWRPAPRG